jgi:hypothetical protein
VVLEDDEAGLAFSIERVRVGQLLFGDEAIFNRRFEGYLNVVLLSLQGHISL